MHPWWCSCFTCHRYCKSLARILKEPRRNLNLLAPVWDLLFCACPMPSITYGFCSATTIVSYHNYLWDRSTSAHCSSQSVHPEPRNAWMHGQTQFLVFLTGRNNFVQKTWAVGNWWHAKYKSPNIIKHVATTLATKFWYNTERAIDPKPVTRTKKLVVCIVFPCALQTSI